MTHRLYYDDSYTIRFEAHVVQRLESQGRPAVVLDRTYFYPMGGGQPPDLGVIGGIDVLDVYPREDDHEVIHVLAAPLNHDTVICQVDWERRFDHMQHHTGQHILTRAFIEIAGADTVGFHLGEEVVTIDLDREALDEPVLQAAERLANQIVLENRPVTARLLGANEAADIRMRKTPDYIATDGLRVVEVDGFDLTACGGTHVARTGEIGQIKVLRAQKHRTGARIEFVCGWRALRDYGTKHSILSALAAQMTVGFWEVGDAVERLREDRKSAEKRLKLLGAELAAYRAYTLIEAAAEHAGKRIVRCVLTADETIDLRALANHLVERPGVVALLGQAGEPAQIVMACHPGLEDIDMRVLLAQVLHTLGSNRGGGRRDFAQGGGISAPYEALELALEQAAAELLT